MSAESYISNAHPAYIETIYKEYQTDANSVDLGWRKFFEGFEFALKDGNGSTNGTANAVAGSSNGSSGVSDSNFAKELQVYNLIQAYRQNGHLLSDTNPIRPRKDRNARLELDVFGLTEADLTQKFTIGSEIGLGTASLGDIIARLKEIYCRGIGIEYTYIHLPEVRKWVQDRFEQQQKVGYGFDLDKKKRIFQKLNNTTVLEKFLGTKYLGEKRFSLEGGESAIPALDAIINMGGEKGVKECVIGMAHRGRLNVLANIMGKTYDEIFSEFEGNAPEDLTMGDGDVKYHLGFSSIHKTPQGKEVMLKLSPNPSHLEAVNPVVEGYTRARADVLYGSDYDSILPILIHGDAAIAGQGIMYEIVQMSQLDGYYTGGTIHFVINNQIGFTTDFDDARSANYCTSLASMVEAPVLHVNGDDVEAVVFAVELAVAFRQEFNSDVFIDMVCYRKHGHNEADEPQFTQPQLYKLIKKHPNSRDLYSKQLVERGDFDAELAKKMDKEFWDELQARLDNVKEKPIPYAFQDLEIAWEKLGKANAKDFEKSPKTAISKTKIGEIVKGLIKVPEGFSPLRKVNKMLDNRRKIMRQEKTVDWAAAELLAYGSILLDGKNIRMSGQDVKRGTFSHRHAVLYDETNNEEYNRLNHLADEQGKFMIYNSLLSEFGVLGFEFGYAWAYPEHLVIWEAQFGDFANGAQSMIDQFITSGESKWNFMNGIIMLLPHGYEGMGPEHSSARLERYLNACAEYNIIVCNITSPANFFHSIRRQLAWNFRKPMVVMSPKSLLRHPKCISDIDELAKGGFEEVLDDKDTVAAAKVEKVLLCSGKVYYDLLAKKEEDKRKDVAIVRLEQLYPYPEKQLDKLYAKYKKAELVWVQEEPENMGAWGFVMRQHFNTGSDRAMRPVTRKASSSPATGFKKIHLKEQKALINKAFE